LINFASYYLNSDEYELIITKYKLEI
jgi:hypothetical protein